MPFQSDRRIHPYGWIMQKPVRRASWLSGMALLMACGLYWGLFAPGPGDRSKPIEPAAEVRPPISSGMEKAEPEGTTSSAYLPWPEAPLAGDPAKHFLLEMLTRVDETFRRVPSYTATFRKQERLKGQLLPEQIFAMKVRQQPFAIYLKGMATAAGKEIIFARGSFEDKVIAHSSGLSRLLMPKLQVPPEHPLIMAESRHPITNAGIGNLIRRLIGFRQLDLRELEAETTLDRWASPDGQNWLRSVHVHHTRTDERPFTRVEVLYHPETRLPLRFTGFDWPAGRDGSGDSPILGERYTYDDVSLDATLSALDFDPANPSYHFHRF